MNKKKQSTKPVAMSYLVKLLFIGILVIAAIGCGGRDKLELAGTMERRTLEVSAPISEIIVGLPVKVGDQVSKGTIIVQLDTEVVAAELRAHQASLAAAKALLIEARGEYSRQEKLRRANIATNQAYDAARRRMDEAISLSAEKEARIAQARKRLEDLTIRSRVDGILDQLPYEVGERVPAGGVVAVVIANEAPWVRVWLPARAVLKVTAGQDAKVKIEGIDKWIDGKVEHVSREPEFTPHYALTERESAHLVYETRVRLSDANKDIPAGIPAWVKITLLSIEDIREIKKNQVIPNILTMPDGKKEKTEPVEPGTQGAPEGQEEQVEQGEGDITTEKVEPDQGTQKDQ